VAAVSLEVGAAVFAAEASAVSFGEPPKATRSERRSIEVDSGAADGHCAELSSPAAMSTHKYTTAENIISILWRTPSYKTVTWRKPTDWVLDKNRLFAIGDRLADRLNLAKELAIANEADVVVVLRVRRCRHIIWVWQQGQWACGGNNKRDVGMDKVR
jgi:hypothetical protein